jgi:hypothetical protein
VHAGRVKERGRVRGRVVCGCACVSMHYGDLHFVEVRTHLAATATHRQSIHTIRLVGITDTPGHAIGIAKTVGIATRTVVVG